MAVLGCFKGLYELSVRSYVGIVLVGIHFRLKLNEFCKDSL